MYSLKDRVVIITGASSGIGRAAAHEFAKCGAQVVLVARRREMLVEVGREIEGYGRPALVVPADMGREEDLKNLCNVVIQTFGRIDVLVNNAGLSIGGAFTEQDDAIIRKMVEVNVYAPMRLTQIVLPHMLERRDGHIVNVSSVAGVIPSPGQTAYAPTRAAVISFSHALRREVAGHGIRVSAILPGWTRTAMLENMHEDEMRAAGLLNPFINLDGPEVPARAIVDAVIHNRYQVLMGGIQYWWGDKLQRLSPKIMDWFFRFWMDTEKMVQGMKELG